MRTLLALLLIIAGFGSLIAVREIRYTRYETGMVEQQTLREQRPYREINLDLVRRVFCAAPGSDDGGVGTAWMIAQNTFVTAAHLTEEGMMKCFDVDSAAEMKIAYIDRTNDIALLTAPTAKLPEYIDFSCEGFRENDRYIATGWAGGEKFKQTYLRSSNEVTGPGTTIEGMPGSGLRFFKGTIYRGMSGGPVFDDHGVAIGINSATDGKGGGFARDLRDTILCRR